METGRLAPVNRESARLLRLGPLFRAKTRPPAPPERFLPRPRLTAALRQAARKRVVAVCGPAGVGKTTSLASLVRAFRGAGYWYTIDELDADAAAFLHGLAFAVEATLPPSADAQVLLAGIVDTLERRTAANGARAIVVLDDVHRLTGPGVEQALADLIRYLPARVTLILAARQLPARLDPTLRWCAAHDQYRGFTGEDLRLSAAEQDAAAQLFGQPTRTGWIFGLAAARGDDAVAFLRDEVIAALPPAEVAALGRLATLPSFDVPLAATITDRSLEEASRLLARIYDATPLLDRVDDLYRFGEVARTALSGAVSPDLRREVLRSAGRFLRTSDPVRSAELLIQAGAFAEAADALIDLRLLDWLVQLPTEAHRCSSGFPAKWWPSAPGWFWRAPGPMSAGPGGRARPLASSRRLWRTRPGARIRSGASGPSICWSGGRLPSVTASRRGQN
jgi:ATP/maltotriose-dependent transcriptional regulator MalT